MKTARLPHCFLSILLPAAVLAGLRTDIEFAKVDRVSLTLDAYVPDGAGPFPAAIVVHGGGFTRGDKQTFVKPLFDPLTRGGFAWFTINYRLAPKYPFPAAVEDVERAIQYVKKHARQYKVDPKRIALIGESAGGHLVSFVGARNNPKARVAAVVSFYGPHDLAGRVEEQGTISDSVKAFLGVLDLNVETRRLLREASPITYVKKGIPPFLLIHGTEDLLVPYNQSVKMCDQMKQVGAICELYTVEGAPHGIGGWEKNPAFQGYKEKMIEWLRNVMQPEERAESGAFLRGACSQRAASALQPTLFPTRLRGQAAGSFVSMRGVRACVQQLTEPDLSLDRRERFVARLFHNSGGGSDELRLSCRGIVDPMLTRYIPSYRTNST